MSGILDTFRRHQASIDLGRRDLEAGIAGSQPCIRQSREAITSAGATGHFGGESRSVAARRFR